MARKDEKGQEQGGQSPVERVSEPKAEAGGVDLIANVDVPYKKDDGSFGYARGGESFKTDEESANELVAENRAYFAKENDNGVFVVDEERGSKLRADAVLAEAEEAANNSDVEAQNALRVDSSVGNKGAFAAESNDMPGGDAAAEKVGTFVNQGPGVRAERLGAEHGKTRQV